MKFIKLYHPKTKSDIMLNVANIVYMKDAGLGFSANTMIYTTDKNVLGVRETIEEIMNKINND